MFYYLPILKVILIFSNIGKYLRNPAKIDGVQMGTRFVTTEECDASDVFKQTYLNAHEEDIQIIINPTGSDHRNLTAVFFFYLMSFLNHFG